jgi:tRNA threonylcarbamoyladenosine biosynthesis protein TsaE
MTITISHIEDIDRAAREFIAAIGNRRIFAFYGKMGAGKTTFIKAICKALGTTDVVTSPTFAIVNEYDTASGRPVFHFDFYRIKRLTEVFDIGYEEYFYHSDGLCFIEWPELIEDLLPDDTVRVSITEQPDGSRLIEC